MFIKLSLCGVLTLLSTTSAFALSCANDYGGSSSCTNNTQAAGDCTTLGYSKDNVSGCEHYIYCPFNTSYKRCVSQSEKEVMAVGDFLYSDMTTSSTLDTSKTVIGVVFDAENRKAVALKEYGKLAWSTVDNDVPELDNHYDDPENDLNGKTNTKAIMNYCNKYSISCPAAEKAYTYSTTGTKAGDWYLPSSGEIMTLGNVYGQVNDSILKVRGTLLFQPPYSSYYTVYWTSTEAYTNSAIISNPTNPKDTSAESKFRTGYTIGGFPMTVRPMIQF